MPFPHEVQVLAFRRHVLDVLARADGRVERVEQAVVQSMCPDAALTEAGLADEFGALVPAYDEAREEALVSLPHTPLADRLGLMGSFLTLALADDHLDRAEGSLLWAVAQLLGISASQFDAFLDGHDEVGEVELGNPLEEG